MAARALLVAALALAVAGAASPPQAVDVAPRRLSDPAPAAGLVGVYHRFVDWLLCSSPWALVTNFFLSASTSTALLETLAALLLPATYELSCGFVVVEMMIE